MTSASWDPQGEALSALRAIAADPRYGTEALSSAPMMTNLLKDMLPDAPREANVLITAAAAGTATALQGIRRRGWTGRWHRGWRRGRSRSVPR